MILKARGREILFPRRPLIMGILNINDDSFCGDGRLEMDWAMERAAEMTTLGADIIDVGGESARTNRDAISVEEEISRVLPFVKVFENAAARFVPRDSTQVFPPLLSVNTWRPEVAAAVLKSGGDLLNDMGAMPDDRNARICAETGAALLIMHSRGLPKVAHTHVGYLDVVEEVRDFFREKIEVAERAGVPRESIVLDPGIDFAKQASDNLRIYRELTQLLEFKRPVLLPVSRKSVIGRVLDISDPSQRDAGTLSCIVAGLMRGASLFRVHNVNAAYLAIKTAEAVEACAS